MNPFDALGSVILGIFRHKATQAWIRLLVSVLVTSFVTFTGVLGATILASYATFGALGALIVGLGTASLSTASAVFYLWMRSPLTKKIPIALPQQVLKAADEEPMAYIEREE